MTDKHPAPIMDDEYSGRRWTYGLTYRPCTNAGVPKGWIVFSHREDERFKFGTIDFPFELTEFQINQMSLTEVWE